MTRRVLPHLGREIKKEWGNASGDVNRRLVGGGTAAGKVKGDTSRRCSLWRRTEVGLIISFLFFNRCESSSISPSLSIYWNALLLNAFQKVGWVAGGGRELQVLQTGSSSLQASR